MAESRAAVVITDNSPLAPDVEYAAGGGGDLCSTARFYHREAAGTTLAEWRARTDPALRTLAAAPALPQEGALDAEETLLALLLHREEHDERFREALRATGARPLLYIESGRRRRVFGVDARRKAGDNLYGKALAAVRDSFG